MDDLLKWEERLKPGGDSFLWKETNMASRLKPIKLKEKTQCCGVLTLVWVPTKGVYICPCGKTKVDIDGRLVTHKSRFMRYGMYGHRPPG